MMCNIWKVRTISLVLITALLLPVAGHPTVTAAPETPEINETSDYNPSIDRVAIPTAEQSLNAATEYTWEELSPATRPMGRGSHAMTYDSTRGTVVLFGGFGKIPGQNAEAYLNDTWEWNGSDWIERNPTTRPSLRSNSSIANDSARGVVVLFGGYGMDGALTTLNDTWEWNGSNWVKRNPSSRPITRSSAALAYDGARGVAVLFGGQNISNKTWTYLNDTWEWNGTTWIQRNPTTGPRARAGHAMAYDSARGVVVLFGGRYRSGDTWVYLNDIWEWNGTTWTQRYPATRPSARVGHAMAYDSARGVVILFGGLGTGGSLNDTWEWNGTVWTQSYPATNPQARNSHALAYDSARDVTVLFGGDFLDDTWEYGPASFCSNVTEIPKIQCKALVALYESTNGGNWANNTGWLATNTPCSWYGVSCSGGNVIKLDLRSNRLSGPIPPEIGNLNALQDLFLPYNALSGPIPPEIGNLTALRQLWLETNQLSGSIPPQIGNLTNLTYLNLYWNQLSGAIPSEIGNLTMLTHLYLSYNNLSGQIPSRIGNLTALTGLYLSSNQLSGPIPPEIGNLTALIKLYLCFNQLSGPIPSEIGNLTALTKLHLYFNQLSGPIPPEIGNLTALTELNLFSNQLSGSIPPQIGNLTALTDLVLECNQLSGPIPLEIGNLTALTRLGLTVNQLSGPIPPQIGNLTALTHLSLSNNQLDSPIPPQIGNLTALTYLSLSSNQLSDPIPLEIGNLAALTGLYLHDNPLDGELPAALTPLTLTTFTFYDTNWCVPPAGDVPEWLNSIPNLYGTGLICGEELGSLGGTVSLTDTTSVNGVQVNLYRSLENNQWRHLNTTQTTTDGTYQFTGLGQGLGIDYRVQFVDPTHQLVSQYYNAQPTIQTATVITITPGVLRTGIDAMLIEAKLVFLPLVMRQP